MIPIRDNNPRRTVPFVNVGLIIANLTMFAWELSLGPGLPQAVDSMALVPARLWVPGYLPQDGFSILFSMFLHGGWLHLGGNMLYLWIFGDNVEDRLGHVRYLVFYLACGFLASFAHAVTNPASMIPTVGASGAIAGVLGAYLILFPGAQVTTFIPIGFFVMLRELPAAFVLGIWFVFQFFTGVASLGVQGGEESGGVAWFAHIGGFVAGIVLVLLIANPKRRSRRPAR